jgi:dihydrofolate reductase
MKKIVVCLYISLDGVIEEPTWTAPYFNDQVGNFQNDLLFASDGLLLGRKTYQGMAAAWPEMKDEDGFADRINSLPKYVPTTTLKDAKWNANFIEDNVIDEIKKLKHETGQDILMYGSGELIQSLMQHDLIDEFHFILNPVVVGTGKRLFQGEIEKKAFKLVNSQTTDTGVAILSYVLDNKN